MNLSETSLAAFHRVDRTAGQRRVLAWFHAHPGQCFTRQEIADGAKILLQSVAGRVNELVKLGDLKPLKQSRNGGELLQLKNGAVGGLARSDCKHSGPNRAAGLASQPIPPISTPTATVIDKPQVVDAGGNHAVHTAPADTRKLFSEPAGTLSNAPATQQTNVGEFLPADDSGRCALTYVQPTLFWRMSMSVESARIIAKDQANAFYDEALKVLKRGAAYRITA